MSTALLETIKTAGRAVYFAFLGIIVLVLTVITTSPDVAQATVTIPGLNMVVSIGALIVAGTGFLAKAIDRYIHKSDSETNGIAPGFLQG